jgi:hypothetical protein
MSRKTRNGERRSPQHHRGRGRHRQPPQNVAAVSWQPGGKFLAAGALGSALVFQGGTALAASVPPGGAASGPVRLTADVQPVPSVAISGTFIPPDFPVGVYGQYASDPTGKTLGFVTGAVVAGQGMSVSSTASWTTPTPGFGAIATVVNGPDTVTFKGNLMPNFDSTAPPQVSVTYGRDFAQGFSGPGTGGAFGGTVTVNADNPLNPTTTPTVGVWSVGTPTAAAGAYATFAIPRMSMDDIGNSLANNSFMQAMLKGSISDVPSEFGFNVPLPAGTTANSPGGTGSTQTAPQTATDTFGSLWNNRVDAPLQAQPGQLPWPGSGGTGQPDGGDGSAPASPDGRQGQVTPATDTSGSQLASANGDQQSDAGQQSDDGPMSTVVDASVPAPSDGPISS